MSRKKKRIIIILLAVATIMIPFCVIEVAPRIEFWLKYERVKTSVLEDLVGRDIRRYNDGEWSEEFFAIHSYSDNGSGVVYITRSGKKTQIYVHNWAGITGMGGTLPKDGFTIFSNYIIENGVNAFDDFHNDDSDNGIEYAYLHCSEDGISNFYFYAPESAEDGEKYVDLINAFVRLFEIGEWET